MKKFSLIFIILILTSCLSVKAGTDPARAALVEKVSLKGKNIIENEMKSQALNTAGHVWLKEGVDALNDFIDEYNQYLDNFHNVIVIAAETYGIYYEFKQTSNQVVAIQDVIQKHPTNVLASAVRKTSVYKEVIVSSLNVLNDIRDVFKKGSMMTEKERMKILSQIRPKLSKVNRNLRQLEIAIRYSTFVDVWYDITGKAYIMNEAKKKDIIARSRRQWWVNAKSVRVR